MGNKGLAQRNGNSSTQNLSSIGSLDQVLARRSDVEAFPLLHCSCGSKGYKQKDLFLLPGKLVTSSGKASLSLWSRSVVRAEVWNLPSASSCPEEQRKNADESRSGACFTAALVATCFLLICERS